MKPVAVVPTLCTLGNAFCGFLAIAKGADAVASLSPVSGGSTPEQIERFHSLLSSGCWLIFLAMVFDALDGRIARMTQQSSGFGAMLDSLTDMLTFGAAPALLLKFLFESTRAMHDQPVAPKVVLLLTVLYVCCAALRLARFTLEAEGEAESHDYFSGLPTPAAAGCLCACMLFYLLLGDPANAGILKLFSSRTSIESFLPAFRGQFLASLLLFTPLLGILMVSKIRYIHLVNRYMRGRRPYTYVAQIVFVLFLLAILETWALFLGFVSYVLLCPFLSKIDSLRRRRMSPQEIADGFTE
jgi:CDP-diacylglycerol--serine O-phosphatidyltransferase